MVVTITINDDLNSDYGFHKASLSLRDSRGTMFFAGPCTGGSSWARLNRSRGPGTEAIIEAKVLIFKQLSRRFEIWFISFYNRCIGMYMELPRGCQYWNNEEVKFMIEGTESTIHDFGCCYGLRQRFGDFNMYIKKPWRIVSFNFELGKKLSLRCDGRHEHAPCAGRETLHTQIYTSKIVSIILEEQRLRCIDVDIPIVIACTAGSSGNGGKKNPVALLCIRARKPRTKSITVDNVPSWLQSQLFLVISHFLAANKKTRSKSWLRWNLSSLPYNKENPKKGYSSSGATGAGCPTGTRPVPKPWRRVVLVPDHELEELSKKRDQHCLFSNMTQMEPDI